MTSLEKSTEAPLPQKRRRRWLWLVTLPLGLLILGVIVGWFWISTTVNRKLADAIAEANRDDPNWQIDDLMAHREAVPDAENSAIVVARVVNGLPESWPNTSLNPYGQPIPSKSELELAFDRLYGLPGNQKLDENDARVYKAALDQFSKEVNLARTVANLARGRHDLTIGPTLIDTLLSDTQKARNAARLLQVDAALRADEGDLDGALDSSRAILGVGRSIGDEPFAISGLVRVAIGAVSMSASKRVLGQGEPSVEALARLQADLEFERKQPILLRSMQGERATLTELIRRVGTGEVPFADLSGTANAPNNPDKTRSWVSPWDQLLFRYQRAVAIDWLTRATTISKKPSHEWAAGFEAWQDDITRVRKDRFGTLTTTLPLLLMPAVEAVVKAHLRYRGELGAMILLVAAERHRRKTGQWPESLEAIDRAILPEMPLDPATGQPYRMKKGEGRFLVYSVGVNLQDEGGVYEPRNLLRGTSDDVGAAGWDLDRRRQPAP